MKIRNFDKHGKEIGDLTEITIEADATIKAVIAAIEERNNKNDYKTSNKRMART